MGELSHEPLQLSYPFSCAASLITNLYCFLKWTLGGRVVLQVQIKILLLMVMMWLIIFSFLGQVVPIQQILQVDLLTGSRDAAFSVVKQLKCLAFSVFSRCRKSLQLNINAKSLTGFGPAARHEALLRQREVSTACLQCFDLMVSHCSELHFYFANNQTHIMNIWQRPPLK